MKTTSSERPTEITRSCPPPLAETASPFRRKLASLLAAMQAARVEWQETRPIVPSAYVDRTWVSLR